MQRRMPGVVYPDPAPQPSGPPPDADANDERSMALRFVRTAFDPPLPDEFADWLIDLYRLVRDGHDGDTTVPIPEAIRDLGYTFARTSALGTGLSLRDALRLYGRHDVLHAEEPLHDLSGCVALAAALAAYQIHSTVTVQRAAGGATLFVRDQQAQELADLLVPGEHTDADQLGHALELLDRFVDKPRPTPCSFDHHGHCQEHHDDFADGTRFAQHEAYALLVRHGLREDTP